MWVCDAKRVGIYATHTPTHPHTHTQVKHLTDFYLENAKLIRAAMARHGLHCVGGDNAPYIWIKTGQDSWQFFDRLLNEAAVVCTPGAGFGRCGTN